MLKKPAVILVWPTHLDYPVCRWNLERFNKYFSSVWIAWSNHYTEVDLGNFVKSKLEFCNSIDVVRSRDDWRDDAVNNALDKIKTDDPILFLEQDFLIKDDSFFEKVLSSDAPYLFYQEDQRIHPAFALVNRDLIEKTSRDFAVNPPGDHFYKFFNELPQGVNIEELGAHNKEDYYHMAGLSQNYRNFTYDEPFFKPNNFLYYNYKSISFPRQHPGFSQMEIAVERKYGHPPHHTFLDNFFPKDENPKL